MEERKSKIPSYAEGAAFIVKNDKIAYLNKAAEECGLQVGINVRELIYAGLRDYDNFSFGILYLELLIAGKRRSAAVTIEDGNRLFCLLQEFDNAELKAMSLAGHQLMKPLHESILHIQLLQRQIEAIETQDTTGINTEFINRNLFQLMRSINNMMDASVFSTVRSELFTYQNLTQIYDELGMRLKEMQAHLKRKFRYSGLHTPISTMLDRQALERAFYNLISNAVKFSPEDSVIVVKLSRVQNRVLITVSNQTLPRSDSEELFFDRYQRHPVPEFNESGIGLGMTVIRTIANAHKGALYVHPENDTQMSVTMSVGIVENSETMFRDSGFQVIQGGGYDTALVELSEVLPPCMYKVK